MPIRRWLIVPHNAISGPRVMNGEAHDKCGEWIVSKFKQFGCEVEIQKADLKGYDVQ